MARARAPARQNEAEGPGGSEAYRAERQEARKGRLAGRQQRGPRHVKSEEKAAPEAKATADKLTDKQLATARRREGDRKRTARNGQTTSNGNANGQGASARDDLAVRVWQHAAKLEPGAPWKCLRAHGVLDALSLDAYRVTRLPPGLRPDRSRSFLATPAG